MAHLQYMPGDPRLVDQLVYELKSKGIFDQFRKECIADVDTRPAYQNLRQRVETSVSTFLSRQTWKPDLNKNQLREKLRKHILDGNYLEQGVERIVDQVVNPKVASVFIPQVEDLVYNYLGIPRKKAEPDTSEIKNPDLLPEDLEAVSPGSVKSNDDKNEEETKEQTEKTEKMEVEEAKPEVDDKNTIDIEKQEIQDVQMAEVTVASNDSGSMDKSSIPLPAEEIKLESIPAPVNSPPKVTKVELDSIALPHEPNLSTDIPLPDEVVKEESDTFFRPIQVNSEDSNSTSDSSIIRNMSPLTPIRNFNNENSCDAQQGFDDGSDEKSKEKVPSSFRFTIENNEKTDNDVKTEKKEEQTDLSYQFNNQVNINSFNTPMYDDSSNSNNLRIDYESDVNSKTNIEIKPEVENSQDSKKDKKDDKKSHKSSHRSRDSSRHSSSKDKRSDSKHSTSRDSSRYDKKSSSKDDKNKSSKDRERSKDRSDRKDSRDSSKQRSSHKNSSKDKDSKSHRSSSSSHRHSKSSDDKKTPSKESSKDKHSESSRDKSKDKSKDSKSSSHRSDKDKKSSSKKPDDKSKKKDKRDIDDHYSSSGRGNHSRRSTDRDSNDGSSSSKGSQNQNGSKSSDTKKDNKSSSKSDNTSISGDSASPSDKDTIVQDNSKISQFKPVVRIDNHLEVPIANPPRLPFVPDVTLKKPRFAANLKEAKKLMKMRKFLDEEQKRMNQEAALLLEFQANVRPSLSQVYSSISGPELEFACGNVPQDSYEENKTVENEQIVNNSEVEVKEASLESEVKDMESPKNVNIIIDLPKTGMIGDKLEESVIPDNPESPDAQHDLSYDENKPFSELMAEITEYSKASETKTKTEIDEIMEEIESSKEKEDAVISDGDDKEKKELAEDVERDQTSILRRTLEDSVDILESKATTESESIENKYFEVTIITEVLSESDEAEIGIINEESVDSVKENEEIQTKNIVTQEEHTEIQSEDTDTNEQNKETETIPALPSDCELQYFAEHEKYNAEIERHEFSNFLKRFMENLHTSKKMYLINCDSYEENIVKETAATFGEYEIINYYKNGHTKLPNTPKSVVKDVKLSSEVTLPIDSFRSPLFSPVKSECSFELSSDYDTKLDDINKKSRQEVMEIILGTIVDASPSKMPKIDYYTECSSETEIERDESQSEIELSNNTVESETENSLKRRIGEVESSLNNNRSVLTPNKIRKMSDSDQISSTTEETEESSNNNKVSHTTRSKYLGRARRVGLSRPKRCNQSNSPSSDKSVENYSQNTTTPNGKIKTTPRTKVQRYDTSDLYKPKLHYLSRRNNVS